MTKSPAAGTGKELTADRVMKERGETRCDSHHIVEFVFKPHTDRKVFKGVTVNLSIQGLCLYVFTPLKKGQEINIRKGLRAAAPAVVMWWKKLDTGLFKVGLRFK